MESSPTFEIARKAARRFPLLPRTVALVWSAAPGWNLAWLLLLSVQSLIPVGQVYLTRVLVNGLAAAIGKGLTWDNARAPLFAAGLMGGLFVLGQGLQSLAGWVSVVQSETVRDKLSLRLHDQSIAIDYRHFDDPDFYDRLYRARAGGAELPLAQVANLGSLFQSALTLIAMAAVLLRYGLWVPVALLIGTIPTLFITMHNSRRLYRWARESTPRQRRIWYYDWLLTARENAAELRHFGLGEFWKSAYQVERGKLRAERIAIARRQAAGQFAAGVTGLLAAGGALLWTGSRALLGALTLGDIALFAQAFNQGQSLMRSLLQNAGQTYTNLLYLGDFFEFLDLEPTAAGRESVVPGTEEKTEGGRNARAMDANLEPGASTERTAAPSLDALPVSLRLENVWFTYPGSQEPTIKDLCLSLEAGMVTAVVGDNGAGKSTLVKLITRLHDPQQGRILWNGRDVRDFSPDDLRRRITVLLQVPMQYQETVTTNVRLGNLDADEPRVRGAAESSGAARFVEHLPRHYDTLLGRWFEDGVDLSTGEWQQLALARAFARPASLYLLDEPTSALDAWAEADWYARLQRARAGRTTLVITHRLTTAQQADVICVLVGGRIVESGTHKELMGAGGRYAEAWRSRERE
jgi:ATP-binding cassette subfamily B protein